MIKRDRYLNQLIKAKNNGFPKVITGVRRCGKSFPLKEIYREYLLSENIPESRIIILELDDDKNSKYRDPLEQGAYIRGKCKKKIITTTLEIAKQYDKNPSNDFAGKIRFWHGSKDYHISLYDNLGVGAMAGIDNLFNMGPKVLPPKVKKRWKQRLNTGIA